MSAATSVTAAPVLRSKFQLMTFNCLSFGRCLGVAKPRKSKECFKDKPHEAKAKLTSMLILLAGSVQTKPMNRPQMTTLIQNAKERPPASRTWSGGVPARSQRPIPLQHVEAGEQDEHDLGVEEHDFDVPDRLAHEEQGAKSRRKNKARPSPRQHLVRNLADGAVARHKPRQP